MQLLKSVENYGKGRQYAGKFTLLPPLCIDGTWDLGPGLHCGNTNSLDNHDCDGPDETDYGNNLDEGSHFKACPESMACP